ncbi:hypothetical protein DCS_07275 [Drechmeria coniospora]|uniref:Uncharacterized protein n=1 Tax=Drechmeria coniospora TaxID=98403 RepID=A0A151GE21_DRECN|nr:hypothetical protein DCS_07275 [Drechmeria coniospora]KYK55312.1 hypothetical protein DCS_07275 [Drechmeria coniospora]ODA84264.1 hypothetical protein RJ55_02783 [Drechmeria coniospora]
MRLREERAGKEGISARTKDVEKNRAVISTEVEEVARPQRSPTKGWRLSSTAESIRRWKANAPGQTRCDCITHQRQVAQPCVLLQASRTADDGSCLPCRQRPRDGLLLTNVHVPAEGQTSVLRPEALLKSAHGFLLLTHHEGDWIARTNGPS